MLLMTIHEKQLNFDKNPVFGGLTRGSRTARIASSNTDLSPFCVNAEHSM